MAVDVFDQALEHQQHLRPAADVGMDHEALNKFAGLETMKGITKRQVSELVDKINALPDATVADIKAEAQSALMPTGNYDHLGN